MDGLQAADMLVEKYPEAALGAIEAAVRAAPNAMMRGAYVEKAASLRGPAVTAFLRAQLAPPAGLPAQLAAANALFGRAEPAGVRVMPVMIDAWRRIQPELRRPRLQYADPTVPTNEPDAFDSVDGLIDFLATSGDARALVSLDQESRGAPVGVRLAVARVFLPSPWNASGFNVGASNHPSDRATFPGGAAGAAIERLLVSSLDDRERAFGVDVNQDRRTMQDPRVADVAAAALAKRWPATYVFTWTGTSAERDRDIEAIRTRWRRDHGIRAAPSAAAPRRAADSSESDVVRDVRVEGGGPPTPEIASLKGQTLTADRLLALAVALERTLPPDKYEVTCLVARPDSGAGFVVTMTWRPGTVAGQTGWERDLFVHAGETRVFEDAGYSISENNRGGDRVRPIDHHYRRLADAFGTSLETRRHEPIEVSIRIQRVAVVPYRIGPRVP
jgi:hypothetical protein